MDGLSDDARRDFLKACESGDAARVEAVLRDFPAAIDLKDEIGWSPLFYAVTSAQGDVAVLLVKAGADLDHKDTQGMTAAQQAGRLGFSPLTDLLNAAAADRREACRLAAYEQSIRQFGDGLPAPLTVSPPLQLRR
jgi:ankyrin repeat protein